MSRCDTRLKGRARRREVQRGGDAAVPRDGGGGEDDAGDVLLGSGPAVASSEEREAWQNRSQGWRLSKGSLEARQPAQALPWRTDQRKIQS